MSSDNPFNLVNVHGEGTFRSVTLALPANQVRRYLPAGLELSQQHVTPPGTHPVILSFNELVRAEWSVPNPTPSLTYHEFTFGVPYSCLAPGALTGFSPRSLGPYYFMPRLLLDSFLAVLAGVFLWGYAKQLATFTMRQNACSISDGYRPLTSLSWHAIGEQKSIDVYPSFAAVRDMLNQPLVSMVPASIGPWFAIADFDKRWDVATLRPLRTSVQVDTEFVSGFTTGRYPEKGTSSGIHESVLGGYELRAPWRLGIPFAPMLRP